MPSTNITPDQLATLAEKYLDKYQPADYRILILREGIRVDEDGWWDVPIKPSKENVPSFDWINRSVEAACDMDEVEGVHVLFM